MKKAIFIFLNICLGLFLASGAVSLVDDSLRLFLNLEILTLFSAVLTFFAALAVVVVYLMMGITPSVPKRIFLPISIFYLAAILATFPVMIYWGGDWMRRGLQMDLVVSIFQVIVGLTIIYYLRGALTLRWPFLPDKHLGNRPFSWLNLSTFALANIFVLAPAIVIYLFLCAALAINHFGKGFVALHPYGLTVQVRQYVRGDGKKTELVPMAHVADANFYRTISSSFPTNSTVLLEGVTDERKLLTNGISYKRVARSFRLAEQQKEFKPRGQLERADIDVDQFSTNTIATLNLVMLVHAKGLNANTMMLVAGFSPPSNFLEQLDDDLLTKRNHHLLEKIQTELSNSNIIIVPWGAGHMPGIADAIQKEGFHLDGMQDYTVIRF